MSQNVTFLSLCSLIYYFKNCPQCYRNISNNKYTKFHSPILLYTQIIQENVISLSNVNIMSNFFDHVHIYWEGEKGTNHGGTRETKRSETLAIQPIFKTAAIKTAAIFILFTLNPSYPKDSKVFITDHIFPMSKVYWLIKITPDIEKSLTKYSSNIKCEK